MKINFGHYEKVMFVQHFLTDLCVSLPAVFSSNRKLYLLLEILCFRFQYNLLPRNCIRGCIVNPKSLELKTQR